MDQFKTIEQRLLKLDQTVERLAGAVRRHSQEARNELRDYPRVKRHAVDMIRAAAGHQSRAMCSARELARYQTDLDDLLQQLQHAEHHDPDSPVLQRLKNEVRRLNGIVCQWSTPNHLEGENECDIETSR